MGTGCGSATRESPSGINWRAPYYPNSGNRRAVRRCGYTPILAEKKWLPPWNGWVWLAVEREAHQILEVVAGGRDKSAGQLLWSLLANHHIQAVKTDYYPVYPLIIPPSLLEQSKKQTYTVEGYNSLLRHWLARLKRKTKCYSKCLERAAAADAFFVLVASRRKNQLLSIYSWLAMPKIVYLY